uniref:AraC family transcriptional regulator n=1 Tax=Mesocestoides corti TaxID=53468 RepID=A0A5K3G113_MESCO
MTTQRSSLNGTHVPIQPTRVHSPLPNIFWHLSGGDIEKRVDGPWIETLCVALVDSFVIPGAQFYNGDAV